MNSFKKAEKLCSRKLIDKLFKDGSSFIAYPLRLTFCLIKADDDKLQILFNVTKRRFKRAVDRNLLKRRMRESYRTNKILFDSLNLGEYKLIIAFNFIGNELVEYNQINNSLKKSILNLMKLIDDQQKNSING
jgi:ribonuclease P protein component